MIKMYFMSCSSQLWFTIVNNFRYSTFQWVSKPCVSLATSLVLQIQVSVAWEASLHENDTDLATLSTNNNKDTWSTMGWVTSAIFITSNSQSGIYILILYEHVYFYTIVVLIHCSMHSVHCTDSNKYLLRNVKEIVICRWHVMWLWDVNSYQRLWSEYDVPCKNIYWKVNFNRIFRIEHKLNK